MRSLEAVEFLALSTLTTVLLAGPAIAGDELAPGMRLISPKPGTDTFLVDNTGAVVHTWPSGFSTTAYDIADDGTLVRTIITPATAGLPGGTGGGVQMMDFEGNLLWDFRLEGPGLIQHHDVELRPNGNVILIAYQEFTEAEAIAAGRDPALIGGGPIFRSDSLLEIQPTGPTTGDIVWQWNAWDHLIQDFSPGADNFGVVGDHPELIDLNYPGDAALLSHDWIHGNSIDIDEANDWIVFSARNQDEIWLIDASTTTAEAAGSTGGDRGRGGDLLWRWGNPEAYRAGTSADKFFDAQHGANFIAEGLDGAGHVLVFSNWPGAPDSAVLELELPVDIQGDIVFGPGSVFGPALPSWYYLPGDMQSDIMGGAERLPGGNTLISTGLMFELREVNTAGDLLWSYQIPEGLTFHTRYIERSAWESTDAVSQAAGGSVEFDYVGGTGRAGDNYVLLGTASWPTPGSTIAGTSIPLNWDVYTGITLTFANTPLFDQTLGTLDGTGNGSSSFNVTPGLAPAAAVGLVLHHAYVILDQGTGKVTDASNAMAVEIVN